VTTNLPQSVAQAIEKLRSLHDGDLGVAEVVACGKAAIPALRALLFEREPSGLFQTRCRVVEVLSTLKAYGALIEYVSAERIATDPVERLGDDAVTNAAALALTKTRDERVFRLLLRLVQRRSLPGVIGAVGAFDHVEAIPVLIAALEDDASRQTAEAALRRMARVARTDLIVSAKQQLPSPKNESESSLRRRRSALKLLAETEVGRRTWQDIRQLMQDKDPRISILACKICLANAPVTERRDAIERLIDLVSGADWMLQQEIEDCLVAHFGSARDIIAGYVRRGVLITTDGATSQTHRVLARVQDRASRQSQQRSGV
jgi:HEAT repeat protein